jgi:methionyl-tRNA synthetase
MSARQSYFTTPIYYVSDKPHLGSAYTSILADVSKRYCQLFGDEGYMLTGVDEHGQKVQEAAEKRGLDPKKHVDDLQKAFRDLLPQMGIEHDDFIRTTEARHTNVVQAVLQDLFEKGDIYQGDYEGWYSVRAERFFTEKDLVDGKCPDTGGAVERIREKNYFFKMGDYQQELIDHMEANPDWIQPASRWKEVRSFLSKPLHDLNVSRPVSRLHWGIPLPFDENYVTYVWFDALLNYISAIGYKSDEEKFNRLWSGSHHLLGKDILITHSVYWGTMLLAMGLPLPKHLIAHGWWLADNTKMSKSLGNVINPIQLSEAYGTDVLRYVLMRDMTLGLDASFHEVMLVRRNNSDLSNDLGNLLRRSLAIVRKSFDGRIPEPGPTAPEDLALQTLFNEIPSIVEGHVRAFRMNDAIESTLQVVRAMNRYIDHTAPFKIVKTDPDRAGEIMRNLLEGLYICGTLLSPIMPLKMKELFRRLGVEQPPETLSHHEFGTLSGNMIQDGDPIFPRHEFIQEEVPASPPKVQEKKVTETPKENAEFASFEDFLKLKMVVARIEHAEAVEGSDKLLKLTVDAGEEEKRTVVAGISQHYNPDELPGKSIILVANLKPRKIFGVLSQGMSLLAEDGDKLSFLTPSDDMLPGTIVR